MSQSGKKSSKTRMMPSTTPEGRENQLIAKAVDLAERQIEEGTVSSQVLTHFLKMGSGREKLERERLQEENNKLRAQIKQIEAAANSEEKYEKAIQAMKLYTGSSYEENE